MADGYGNSRIVHFSRDGRFIKIIGGVQDTEPGEFNESGDLLEIWTDLGMSRPTGITVASDDTVYVGDTDGNAIWVLKDGRVLEKIGDLEARPHNIVLDSGTDALSIADTTEPGQIKRITRK